MVLYCIESIIDVTTLLDYLKSISSQITIIFNIIYVYIATILNNFLLFQTHVSNTLLGTCSEESSIFID